MSNYEATKYDFDGANLTGIEGIPTATIVPWSSSSVPSGFLECNGAAVSRSTYSALFAIVGTTYGAGDGASTFNLPDLQDNVAIGKSGTKALASTGGANTVQLETLEDQQQTQLYQQHNLHLTLALEINPGGPSGKQLDLRSKNYQQPIVLLVTTGSTGHSHNMSATFTGDATSVVQPYLTVIYIIKT